MDRTLLEASGLACHRSTCEEQAQWEGYADTYRPITGEKIGFILIRVCNDHKKLLNGAKGESS